MNRADKSREARVRRILARRFGYTISRSRLRDPLAIGYGLYAVTGEDGQLVKSGQSLAELERLTEAAR